MEQPDESNKKLNKTWVLVGVTAIITTLLVGGGFYWWQKVVVERAQEEDLERQQELLGQIQKLQDEINGFKTLSELEKNETNEQVLGCFSERFVGESCYKDRIFPSELQEDFTLEPSNIEVKYTNKEKGISFKVPYNKSWGNSGCMILPYFEYAHPTGSIHVNFGRPYDLNGYDKYSLTIDSKRSAEEIIAEQNHVAGEPHPNPRKKTINNHEVVIYESYGMGVSRIMEIVGNNFNYSFEELDIDKKGGIIEESKELEEIISGIELLEIN